MSITSNLLAALKADPVVASAFTTLEHSLEMDVPALEIRKENLPALILFPGIETTEPNEYDAFVAQSETKYIHVLIVAPYVDIDDRKKEVRDVALGWQNDSFHDLTEKQNGEPIKQVGKYLYWLDTYITRTQIRQT